MSTLSSNSGATAALHPHGEDVGHLQPGAMNQPELPEALQRTMEALIKALHSAVVQYASEQLNIANDRSGKRNIAKTIDDMVGYVNHKNIEKTGATVTYASVTMPEGDLKEFFARLKRHDIQFSGVIDIKDRELTQKITCTLESKQDDFESIKTALALFNDEMKLKELDKHIASFEQKGESNLSNQEKAEYHTCLKQRDDIVDGHCDNFNDGQACAMIERASGAPAQKGLAFCEALNSETGGRLNKGYVFVVADATDPAKHVVCRATDDFYNEQPYIKTYYDVYNGNKHLFKTHDGRFYGRDLGYWGRQKTDMQNAGGFSDTLIKFKSVDEYKKYMQAVAALNEKNLWFLNPGDENSNLVIETLQQELANRGLMVGTNPSSAMFGKVIGEKDGMEVKVDISELNNLREDYWEARESAIDTQEGTQGRLDAQRDCNTYLEAYHDCLSKAKRDAESIVIGRQVICYLNRGPLDTKTGLLNERKQLNSLMAGYGFRAMDEITNGKREKDASKDEKTKKMGEAVAKKISDTNQITDVINRKLQPPTSKYTHGQRA